MYQGHPNWNHWNVRLWINNDEGLYHLALELIRANPGNKPKAAKDMLDELNSMGIEKTKDGTPYTKTTILYAMRGLS